MIFQAGVAEALTGGGGTGSATGDAIAFGGDHNSIQRGKYISQVLFVITSYLLVEAPYIMIVRLRIPIILIIVISFWSILSF